jgi:hypothetical protein
MPSRVYNAAVSLIAWIYSIGAALFFFLLYKYPMGLFDAAKRLSDPFGFILQTVLFLVATTVLPPLSCKAVQKTKSFALFVFYRGFFWAMDFFFAWLYFFKK